MHWRYCSLALSHQYEIVCICTRNKNGSVYKKTLPQSTCLTSNFTCPKLPGYGICEVLIWYSQYICIYVKRNTCQQLSTIKTIKPVSQLTHWGWEKWLPFPRWHFQMNENVYISIKIPLKFVPKGPINNILALVQIMASHQIGDKPLSDLMID